MTQKTIQQLREERGESRDDLASSIHAPSDLVADWELGRAEPTITWMMAILDHYGVAEHELNLRPADAPTLLDRLDNLLETGPTTMRDERGYGQGTER